MTTSQVICQCGAFYERTEFHKASRAADSFICVVVFADWHLRHLLRSYATYYNEARTHLSVNKDAPSPRTVHSVARILPTPCLGGLHHLCV
jgi:hypothetical protein